MGRRKALKNLLKFEDPISGKTIRIDPKLIDRITKNVHISDMRVKDEKLVIKYTSNNVIGEVELKDLTYFYY